MASDRSILSLKRKRQSDASKTLSKPFVTPFKHPRGSGSSTEEATTISRPDSVLESCSAINEVAHDKPDNVVVQSSSPALPQNQSRRSDEDSPRSSSMIRQSTHAPDGDQTRKIRQLERQIRTVRSDIDTLQRANALTESQNEKHLHNLVLKWRHVAQEAADELFPAVKDRVDSMGGIVAWRHAERVKHNLSFNADESETVDPVHVEQEHASNVDNTSAAHLDPQDDGDDGADQDTSFNMIRMLQTLNIDPKLIGYNVTEQTWI